MIPLEDFQVHGIACRPGVIELVGWSEVFCVNISDVNRPTIAVRTEAFNPRDAASAANLGHWAREQVIDLEAAGAPGIFQLIIARVSRRVAGGIEHHTISEIIRRDTEQPGPAQIVASMTLFNGIFLETID